MDFGIERANLLDHCLFDLGRMAAGLQQGQHQRGEFMPHGDAREAYPRRLAGAPDAEGGAQLGAAVGAHRDLPGEAFDVPQQAVHFL